jgi:carboxymethylenebutenolidase
MAIKGEWIRYGERCGYLAFPERAALPLPAVVVIQEIWGVDDHIEDVTRRIAAAGYAAIAPDLYAPNGERPAPLTRERVAELKEFISRLPANVWADEAARAGALAKLPDAERERIGETFGALFGSLERVPELVPPLRETVRYLRKERSETKGQPVACVGFCMGGGLAALLASEEPEISGAAVYYGRAPEPDRIATIACPIIAFYGATDARVNVGIPAFEAGMKKTGTPFEFHVYDGSGHAFFNDTRPSYDVRAARDSFARLLAFLARTLTGS